MIEVKDVIRMRVPFPNISSQLATQSHMYICVEKDTQKKLLKCQRSKPLHLLKSRAPFVYLLENPDLERNPFIHQTIIDCDKTLKVNGVTIDLDLLTTSRKDVCEDLYQDITSVSSHEKMEYIDLDPEELKSLNHKLQ